MPYDELGNFIYDDAPSLDEMRLELAKKAKNLTAPVEQAIRHLPGAGLAEAAATMGSGMLAMPPAAAYAIARGIASGEYGKSTKQAENYFGEAMDAMTYRPRTESGREILQTIEELPRKITGSHMGFGPLPELMVPMTRGVTPNDVRVMGANARRIGNEIVELPQDFRNAQSGLKRQNAFGEPTLGVKAEAAASDIGDVIARRQAAGKSAIPGVPDVVVPETNLYAVRNTGEGQLLTPTDRPGINTRDLTNYGQMARVNEAALGFNPQTFREQPIEQFNRYMDEFINPEAVPEPIRKGWSKYFQERVQGLFPDATDKHDATSAWSQLISPSEQVRYKNEFLQDFVNKPENKELARAAGLDLPSVDEYKTRVEAAEKWLKGPFTKYVQKFVGTKDDPLLQLAEKGLTPISPERILQEAEDLTPNRLRALEQHRQEAGFNPKGEYLEKVNSATLDLNLLKTQERELSTQQNAIARRLAETNPGEDPAAISPEFAKLSNQVTAKVNQIDKLEKQLEGLKTAQAYETLSDYAILPHTAGEIKQDMTYVEQKLFPGLAKTPDEAKMIELSRTGTQGSGIEEAAKEYVQDIISGKLPIKDISNMSFEKHIGKQAGVRAQAAEAAKAAEKQKINALNTYAQERVNSQPDYLKFGNANVVEFTQATPLDELRKGLSFETEMLDHCLGSGGSGAGRKHFITKEDRSHTPIIDPITGEVPKGSSGNDRGYVDNVRNGSVQIASIRDANTGYPAVTIEMNKYGRTGKYNLGYVSGYKNKVPEPEYRNATRDYLNSRADEIEGIGSNLERYGIYDQNNLNDYKLSQLTDRNPNNVSMAQLQDLPRFLTQNDLKQAVAGEVVDIPPLPPRPARENLPAVTAGQSTQVSDAMRQYRSWIEDRYPNPADRLAQVTEDLSDITSGRVAPGQFNLDAENFEMFYDQLERLQTEIAAERNRGNRDLALQRDDNGRDRLIREEQHNVDRAWDLLPMIYDYEQMTPAQIREQAATLRRNPPAVLREYAQEFLLNPGFIEGLARQVEEQANQQHALTREMNDEVLNNALDESLQAIRDLHGETIFNRTIEIANNLSNDIDLTTDPEHYISALRQDADIYHGDQQSALHNLADDLEAAHLGQWEPAEDPGLALPAPAAERPRQPDAPRGEDVHAFADYYTNEATGSRDAFLRIVRDLDDNSIRQIIQNTAGDAMYDDALIQHLRVDSPAGVSQLHNALRRYMNDRGREAAPAQLPAPARQADHLPAVPDIPMGRNFLSDAIDEMLDDDHIDTLMEMYRGIAEDIDSLSDRGSQRDILRRVRGYADEMREMDDIPAANAIDRVADLMRQTIIDESGRPEGHATGGIIESYKKGGASGKKPVYFAKNHDAMRYELLRKK